MDDLYENDKLAAKIAMKRKFHLSPARADAFDETTDEIPFAEIMKEKIDFSKNQIDDKLEEAKVEEIPQKRSRWDKSRRDKSEFAAPAIPSLSDETPGRGLLTKSNNWDTTPMDTGNANDDGFNTPVSVTPRRSRFNDEIPSRNYGYSKHDMGTPKSIRSDIGSMTPSSSARRSRWDQTPRANSSSTPAIGMITPTSVRFRPGEATPMIGSQNLMTPEHSSVESTPSKYVFVDRKHDPNSIQLSDAELNSVLPDGYRIIKPPKGYQGRVHKPKITATPTPMTGFNGMSVDMTPKISGNFVIHTPVNAPMDKMNQLALGAVDEIDQIPICTEDAILFQKLLNDDAEHNLKPKEKEVLTLILRIKNGEPRIRRSAMREITRRALEFGHHLLFDNILPVLVEPNIDEQQRHLMVKLLDRLMYKLEDKVRPYTHKILIIVMPMLIEEDRVVRQEGREVISNLSKIVGLSTMISALRPDIDNEDDSVRKVAACSFAVVAHSLGLGLVLPFLKAVCTSKKGWKIPHTGMRIVREIAVSMRCRILPYLNNLVSLIAGGLNDSNPNVKTMTVLTISSLAEAVTPYGIEVFGDLLKPLWKECRSSRGKHLAAVIKAISFLIPLLEPDYRMYYADTIITVIVRNFQTPDESFKLILLNTIEKMCQCKALKKEKVVEEVIGPFFKCFWNSRSAVVKVVSAGVVDTVLSLTNIVGVREIISLTLEHIKSDTEMFKRMAIETCDRVLTAFGSQDLDHRMVKLLIDGLKCAFEEQTTDQNNVMINSFGNIINNLGDRCEPYIETLVSEATYRMNNRSQRIRKQAADVMGRLAKVAKLCGKDKCLMSMSQLLFEYLGEEFPDALGSIIKAIEFIVREKGLVDCHPPVVELLPRLTPILKNRQEKVQENCLELVGFIASEAGDQINSREWMRICFDMIEILKSPKKSIRRAAIMTFGHIAATIGPSDVVSTLLTNLKTQERQNRICSTVAIAVVAERCRPFTVLPFVMNEYRVADLFVQHGVLKSLAFMFEYVGEEINYYVDAITPLLAEALTERDVVHRQTAIAGISHLAVNVHGYGHEDALIHLLNNMWPNVLETSPHLQQAFMRCIDAMRVALGPTVILQYVIHGLWHPAKAVRSMMWKVYNTIYMGNPDVLITGYTRVEDEPNHNYTRYTLHYRL